MNVKVFFNNFLNFAESNIFLKPKVFSGQKQLNADKSNVEITLHELETKIWLSDFAAFEEK